MKNSINEYLTEIKKYITPKALLFLAAMVAAFIIHPLIGLIFVGVGINFAMSIYTSKGVLRPDPNEEKKRLEVDE